MKNQEKLAIAEATFDAYTQADILEELIADFIETYLQGTEEQKNLKFEIEQRPQRIEAKVYTLLNIAHQVKQELEKLAE